MLMGSPKHSPGLRNAGHESLQLNVNDLKFTTLQRRGRAPWKQFGDPPLPRGKYAVLYITLMGQFTKLVKPGLRCNSLRCGEKINGDSLPMMYEAKLAPTPSR